MSGFVLTFRFEREPLALATSTLRRVVRLGVPLAAAAILCFLAVVSFPELHLTAARLSGSRWLADVMPADPFHALADAAGAGMLIGYRDTGLFQQLLTCLGRITLRPTRPNGVCTSNSGDRFS